MHKPDKENSSYRNLSDRRDGPTPIISRYTFSGGRRKKIRRHSEKKKHIFVDVYSTRLLVIVVALLLMSTLDAFLTLALIEKGKVVEANPVMAYLLDYGIFYFSLTKFMVTAVAMIILCLFKNVHITRRGVPVVMAVYMAVIIYELFLYMI